MKTLRLKPGKERSIERRHPWIFSGALAKIPDAIQPGELVRILSANGDFCATGAVSPASSIAVKIWSFEPDETIDESLLRARVHAAFELRKRLFADTLPDAFRLVHAEADNLPGLIADVYPGFVVCQITSAAMEPFRHCLPDILAEFASEGNVFERSDVDSRTRDGLPPQIGILAGQPPPENGIPFTENGAHFLCFPDTGHKTGFYLDQRINRLAVKHAAKGLDSVLNCFSYTGAFGIAALAGGAKHVLNIDSSAPSLALAQKHAERNGFPSDSFEVRTADVFQFLRTCRDSRKSFDMIIMDPPKLAETAAAREKAARAYKDLNLLALKLLNPGGFLFTFSCSGAMDEALFTKVVDSAACDAKIDFKIFATLAQGPDHPVSAFFPESRYLKGLAGIRPL